MKICNKQGVGICVGCSKFPEDGSICREHVQEVVDSAENGYIVTYNKEMKMFLRREPLTEDSGEWEIL